MNPKYQKVCAEIAKTEKKVEDLPGQLKELYDKKTELENLEIVHTVRSMVMDKDQIMAFLAAMKDGKADVYKRQADCGRQGRAATGGKDHHRPQRSQGVSGLPCRSGP